MAIQTYQVRVKDLTGATVAIFGGTGYGGVGDLQSITYTRRLRTLGQFTLYIDGRDSRIDYLKTINAQVEVWRRDPQAGLTWLAALPSWQIDAYTATTGWYKDFEGFVRGWNRGYTDDGRRVFVAQGRGYNDILAGETVNYPKNSAQSEKTGTPGAVAAAYVNQNIGAGAGVDSQGLSRVRLGLTEFVESDTGVAWSGDKSYINLLDVLQELAQFGPGDYQVIGTGPATFQFRWRGTRWGLDCTPGNSAGNIPCVFSTANNNVSNVAYGYNALDEANVIYVQGQGSEALRKSRSRATAAATAFNWSRRAVSRDARDSNSNTVIDNRADSELDAMRARYYAKFDVRQTPATRYGRDWDLGYLVRFTDDDGNNYDLKINGVTVNMNQEGDETITPELEEEM